MKNKISEWKIAKDLCESISQLNQKDQFKHIDNSDVSQSIKQKAKNLIHKLNADFDLIESGGIDSVLPVVSDKANLIGKQIDDYQLIKILGSGGMSTVYLAKRTHSDIQKFVALKILSPYATADKYLELFNREQKSLAQLNHNNIVSLHHGGQTDDGTNYLVMDYVEDARDAISYVKENNLSLINKLKLIKSIALAVSYAHKKNIIHRDLKSANILIDNNNQVKIVDFGIALFAEDAPSDISTRVFTIDIASPEQIQGKKIDLRTDVFSLGALLLQILTDKAPTPNVIPSQYNPVNVKKYTHKLLKQSNLNTDLINIIQTAMHIDVQKRYENMDDFACDLDNYLNHRPVNASRDSVIYRMTKFFQRNVITSSLVSIVFIISIIAFITISNNIFKRNQAIEQNTRSTAFLDALFEQANPIVSKKNTDDIISTLESIKHSQKDLLESDPEFKYNFYHRMTSIYDGSAMYNKALESEEIALTALALIKQPDNDKYINSEILILDYYHATGNSQLAISKGIILLEKLHKIDDLPAKHILNVYELLSKAHSFINQYEKAVKIGDLAQKLMLDNPSLDPIFKASMLNSIAVVQRTIGNNDQASKFYLQAINLLRGIKNVEKRLSSVLTNYAIFKGRAGDMKASEELFLESIELMKSIDPYHPNVGSIYLSYSTLLSLTNRIDEAQTIIKKAVVIFKKSNGIPWLADAYSKLANFALMKNDLKTVMENIVLSNDLMIDKFGIDHSETLYLYNLSLWLLMLEPYEHYAQEILDYLSKTDYVHSVGSSKFAIYQVQKAFLNNEVVSNNRSFSLLSQYLYGEKFENKQQRIDWLKQHIESKDKQSKLVKSFLHIWLLELHADSEEYINYCLDSSSWDNTSRLAFKINLMEQCVSIAETNNYELRKDFIIILSDLNQQILANKNIVKNFVKALTR